MNYDLDYILHNGHTTAGANQFGEGGVEDVVGKGDLFDALHPCNGDALGMDVKGAHCELCILPNEVVEITNSKDDDAIGVFPADFVPARGEFQHLLGCEELEIGVDESCHFALIYGLFVVFVEKFVSECDKSHTITFGEHEPQTSEQEESR